MSRIRRGWNHRWVRSLLAVLLLVGIAVRIAHSDKRHHRLRKDFTTFTLAASRVMFDGGNPYDRDLVKHNYKYFPTNAVLLYPFTKINVYAAQGVWYALNVGLLMLAFASMGRLLGRWRVPWWIYLLAIGGAARVVVSNLRLGQWNTSVFCLSIIGLALVHGRPRGELNDAEPRDSMPATAARPWLGSALLGLAITLKFMPAIFLVYFALRRRWLDLGRTLLAVVIWIIVFPAICLGPSRTLHLLQEYREASTARMHKITRAQDTSSVSVHSVLYRALSPVPLESKGRYFYSNVADLNRRDASRVAAVCSAVFLLGFFAWVWRMVERRRGTLHPLQQLVIIGMFYVAWFIAMPGVRMAQLISLLPALLGVLAVAWHTTDRTARNWIIILFAAGVASHVASSEFVNETTYNLLWEASGAEAVMLLLLMAAGVLAFYAAGRLPDPPSLAGD